MRIGILGGGQLAMMMVQMSNKHGIDFIVVDPNDNPPASKYAKCIKAEYNDKDSLDYLIDNCDVVTIDFENVPSDALKYLENKVPVYPGSYAVEICQDRLKEKNIFNKNNIPTTEYCVVSSKDDLASAINVLGTNSILKSRKLGYDGKNQITINEYCAKEAWSLSGKAKAILEKKVDFETEVSIIGICTKSSGTIFYPLVENFHKNGILNLSIAPYENTKLQKLAESYHNKITEELNYIGVLVIEFFIDKSGNLIANEMAPRVHNSGHWTNEGASISQFEAHIMAISGIKIKNISINGNSAMLNILSKMPMDINNKNPCYKLYDYGKSERLNRKLGHITVTDNNKKELIKNVTKISKSFS
ncbi:MAG: 5-(carboxyamino)imidazole ribonucleotide synthase [Gammaproteobacteria bacterium]|jgi:5-(carboxyamino)imidazole ribonucleotide synthase|nr:5-(carboxyamino)imidazole ribonucleotide synthase [Gammaproteobacteria bacterium]MBT4462666.1 5-(carboxyamino)imidazole ribonucleotide synthase [Gammaproteobacteria bacterium]MBT4654913.1 5-(carboxyamino)imidazole ribonucleotide synthase [Gammaproteobacteria bacterium]MBT5116587.1 5-(carboxyamino)imidazole ribonucleotide synthase [Gammaproteobacteria bacterium]MBT5761786.1 5-(carboxyamino)imidazole ribonucleotide synthase [Gammaproteobacteria bacterium]